MEEALILRAFEMLLQKRRLPKGAIVHLDRGGQYAGKRFRNLLRHNKLRQSMSRAGETSDNAFSESLFSRYKTELLENSAFADVEKAKIESFNYIEIYYNKQRRHSSLRYKTPVEFEREFIEKKDAEMKKKIDNQKVKGIKVAQHSCFTF